MLERQVIMDEIGRLPICLTRLRIGGLLQPSRVSDLWIRVGLALTFIVVALTATGAADAILGPRTLTADVVVEMNVSLPRMIDRSTRLDRVQMTDQRLTYTYTITDEARARQVAADPTTFAKVLSKRLCDAHTDLGAQSTRFDYFDTRRALVASFTATKFHCEMTKSVIVADALQI